MLLDTVKDTIKRYELIEKGDKIIIGVSGGPDSVTLLYTLNKLKKELKINLHIAHLDHMLRQDSAKDSAFVKALARKLKLPVTIAAINVRKIFKRGSLEEAARDIRLDFLFRLADRIKADKIALGHNFDDQAETVLMRILRGTGLQGLSAILPKKEIKGYQIIRPLIKVKRNQIEAFLRKHKIKPRIDLSNLKDIYLRNKIRNRLLPLLEGKYNPKIKEALCNMAESAGEDYDYLYSVSQRALKNLARAGNGQKLNINLQGFLTLHPSIRRLVLRMTIARLKGNLRRITFKHMQEIEDLISNRPVNSVVDLPKGISIIKKKTGLSITLR